MTETLIRALKSRIKTLELENEKLRQRLENAWKKPPKDRPDILQLQKHFSLSRSEAIILNELAKAPVAELKDIFQALYQNRKAVTPNTLNCVRVLVGRMKQRFRAFPVKNIHGTGYFIPLEARQYITQVITGNAEGMSPNDRLTSDPASAILPSSEREP